MHTLLPRLATASLVLALLGAGCATPPPPAVSSSTRGASHRRAGASTRKKPVLCIATRESTRRQREIAQAAARRVYFAKQALRRRAEARSRYVAVLTERNTDSTGEASCMVFERQTGNLINSTVFDCDRVPKIGETVKFATFSATYVGG